MKTMKVTVSDFCKIQGLKSQVEANSIINMLRSQGVAIEVGLKRRADGRGKPAKIYEIPQTVTLTLFKDSDMTVESKSVLSETAKVVKPIMDYDLAALNRNTEKTQDEEEVLVEGLTEDSQ